MLDMASYRRMYAMELLQNVRSLSLQALEIPTLYSEERLRNATEHAADRYAAHPTWSRMLTNRWTSFACGLNNHLPLPLGAVLFCVYGSMGGVKIVRNRLRG